ncbi:MAG: hypothetical protein V4633_17190 [Pseudomonadota bacterium]
MNLPNFDNFDIEYSELSSCERIDGNLRLKFDCPVVGWRWKKRIARLMRLVMRKQEFYPFLEFQVELTFFGIEKMACSFLNEVDGNLDAKIFANGLPVLSNVFCHRISAESGLAQFEFDEGTMKIIFADCIQHSRGRSFAVP